jgi:hypothetical protein
LALAPPLAAHIDCQMGTLREYTITKPSPSCICGRDTFRQTECFLVVENRWLDRLKILSWHSSARLAEGYEKPVLPAAHLTALTAHWLTRVSPRLPAADLHPVPIGSDRTPIDVEPGSDSVGRLGGELAVHRESFSRAWSGSPAALECILDALISIGAETKPHALAFHLFDPPRPSHGPSPQ